MYYFILKGFLLLSITALSLDAATQTTVNVDSSGSSINMSNFYSVSGEPRVTTRFTRITEGTPYLVNRWSKSRITLKDGSVANGVITRLNLVDNEIHYLNKNTEYILERPVKELVMEDTLIGYMYIFRSGFPSVQKSNPSTLLQVMTDGKVTLLKHHRKVISENKPYGSATTEQSIRNADVYYIYGNGKMSPVKNNRSDLLFLFNDRRPELEAFIHKEGLRFKNEADLIRIVEYYNGL